tara:strand:+ start:16 stop:852 length:837 start_codon:yes stop_codon:yes gene_type:complete
MNENRVIRILSLGAGVQSSAVLLMAIHGEIKPIEHCIFSDTGWEPKHVYSYLEKLKPLIKKSGIQFHRVQSYSKNTTGSIKEDALKNDRFAAIPFHTLDVDGKRSIMRRQCTSEYKILPVERRIREIMGLKYKQRYARKYGIVHQLMGISTDEVQRAKDNHKPYIFAKFPLLDLGMSRQDCLNWMADKGYELPKRSACIGCPYHDNSEWLNLKENHYDEFMEAVDFEKKMQVKLETKFDGKVFLHPSCEPLETVDFASRMRTKQPSLFDNECEGMCGV